MINTTQDKNKTMKRIDFKVCLHEECRIYILLSRFVVSYFTGTQELVLKNTCKIKNKTSQ